MLEIIKRQRGVLAFMLTLAMVLTTVGCNSKTALVEDGSPESKSVTYTEENIGTLKSEMQGNGSYTSVQLSAIKPVKSDDVTAIAWNKSTDLVMSVGQANLRTATTTPAGKKVAYTSSDTKVASVDATGNVYCLAPGEAVITAASGKKSVSYKILLPRQRRLPRMPQRQAQENPAHSWGTTSRCMTTLPRR